MIPTLLVFGLVLGRWWRPALPAAVMGWPIALVIADVEAIGLGLLAAAALAAANVTVGILAHQALLAAFRRARNPASPPPSG